MKDIIISKLPTPGETVGVSGWICGASYSPVPTELYPQPTI